MPERRQKGEEWGEGGASSSGRRSTIAGIQWVEIQGNHCPEDRAVAATGTVILRPIQCSFRSAQMVYHTVIITGTVFQARWHSSDKMDGLLATHSE